jgi:uracil-DNA glycosylase family 4
MNKKEKLEKLNKKIKECKRCPLWQATNNSVPGEGSICSKIMFIGEAPGHQEDLTGRPFIGRAGELLSRLLKITKIKRENVFITSVIKHRPPKNRQPKKPEIKACKIWWRKQIEILKPKLIILLGRVASDTVLGKDFWKERGRLFQREDEQYFITYHPAAGIRFPKIKKILEKDFAKIGKTISF